VHIMRYDPKAPFHERYVKGNPAPSAPMKERVEKDAITLCKALGYDLNTVEFAVEGGVPYAIDFCNPAPDAEVTSVGQENFEWVVEAVANMAIRKAKEHVAGRDNLSWGKYMQGAITKRSLQEMGNASLTQPPSYSTEAVQRG